MTVRLERATTIFKQLGASMRANGSTVLAIVLGGALLASSGWVAVQIGLTDHASAAFCGSPPRCPLDSRLSVVLGGRELARVYRSQFLTEWDFVYGTNPLGWAPNDMISRDSYAVGYDLDEFAPVPGSYATYDLVYFDAVGNILHWDQIDIDDIVGYWWIDSTWDPSQWGYYQPCAPEGCYPSSGCLPACRSVIVNKLHGYGMRVAGLAADGPYVHLFQASFEDDQGTWMIGRLLRRFYVGCLATPTPPPTPTPTPTPAPTPVPTPGFTLAVSPSGVTLSRGSATGAAVSIRRLYGFADSVSLSASGLPSGITTNFNPASASGNSSALKVSASSSAAVGTSTVTIVGTGGGRTATAPLAVTVSTAPNFTLTANPGTMTVARDGTARGTIDIGRWDGFTGAVSLSVGSLPSGVSADISPASTSDSSATLTLSASSSATIGASTVTITGVGSGLTRTTSLLLDVTMPQPAPTAAPALQFPIGCVETLTPAFTWTAVTDATFYQIELSRTVDGAVVLAQPVGGTSFVLPAGLLAGSVAYTWRVNGQNSTGEGPFSPPAVFTPMCSSPPEPTPTPVSEDPSKRPPSSRGPCGGPQSIPRRVSVTTGNMFFDQTDIVLPGVGPTLEFTRSYNSQNAASGTVPSGALGPGWTHTYEQSLRGFNTGLLLLRRSTGVVAYFSDPEGDGTYTPFAPVTEESKVVRQVDGTFIRRFRRGGQEKYLANGRLTEVVDVVGNKTTFTWTGSELTQVRDQSGRALNLTYTGGLLTRLAGPEGIEITYGYSAGRLETATYKDGSGYRFAYDSVGQMTTMSDLAGKVLETHTYEDERAVSSEIAGGVERETLSYGPGWTTVTDGSGAATNYEHSAIQQVRQVTRVNGACSACGGGGQQQQAWTYDALGQVASRTDGNGLTTTYEHDPVTGDVLVERDALQQPTIYSYYEDGRVRTITQPDGSSTTYTYVAAGPDTITEWIDATTTRVTRMEYNAQGKIERLVDPRSKVTTFEYDPAGTGDLVAATDPLGHTTRFGYDGAGRKTSITVPVDETTTMTTRIAYDARGRVQRVTQPDNTFIEFTYDSTGQLTRESDSAGRVTQSGYDQFGRLSAVLDPLSGTTRQDYDVLSNLVKLTDAEGRAFSFEYDAYRRLKKIVYPGTGVEAHEYDAGGRLVRSTDRKNVVTSYDYDPLGRLTRKSYSDGTPEVTFTYDVTQQIFSATNAAGTLVQHYDRLGRTLSEAWTPVGGTTATTGYLYDAAGNRLSLSLDAAPYLTYVYDDASRLQTLTRGGHVFTFDDDDAGRRKSLSYPNDVITTYHPDSMSRLESIDVSRMGSTIARLDYLYDAAGNRTRKTTLDLTEEYEYDRLDRLTAVSRPGSHQRRAFTYDRVGNRSTEALNGNVRKATYNERNQLVSQEPGGPVEVAGTVNEPATVTVNGQPATALAGDAFESTVEAAPGTNTVTVEARDGSGNVQTKHYGFSVSGAPTSYSYDPNGNLIQKVENGQTWSYVWDAENQLTSVTRDGVEVAHFAYDPLGRRVEKAAGGITYAYTYDGDDIVTEARTSGGVTTTYRYVHGPGIDEPLAREDQAGSLTYYHADALGSIVKMTDQAGQVVQTYQYDAWGNIEQGAEVGGYSFTGREWDPEIEFYYYRARYYDPKVGRFVSEDDRFDDRNLYNYVGANPTKFVDPEGHGKLVKLAMMAFKRLKNGKVYAVTTDVMVNRDRARFLIQKRGASARGSEKAMRGMFGPQGIMDPAHVDRNVAGEVYDHLHTADRRGGHAAFGKAKKVGALVAGFLASNAIATAAAAESDPCITTADVWAAGAWDVATTIDPFIITDAIEWAFGLGAE